ncbi:hypothetical protein ACVWZZ_003543 [Bradyrhizobium sp. LM6.10]
MPRIRALATDPSAAVRGREFRVGAVTGQIRFRGTLRRRDVRREDHRELARHPSRRISAFMLAAALMPQFAVTGILLYLSRRKLRRPDDPPSSCHFACMRRSSMTTSVLMA